MSYTEMYKFKKDGYSECIAEIQNSFRGAMAVWDILDNRYLPPYVPEWAKRLGESGRKYHRSSEPGGEKLKEVWALYDNPDVSIVDKICLGTTFDRVIVMKENIDKVIEAFEKFEGETSLKEQAIVLKEALEDDDLIAVSWNQTSVNCGVWDSEDYTDEDEDGDEYCKPYNILTEKRHWKLFDE